MNWKKSLTIFLLFSVIITGFTFAQSIPEDIERWEYKTTRVASTSIPDLTTANELGAVGWELVSVQMTGIFWVLFFKRRIP